MENRVERAGPILLLLSCAVFSTSILLFRPGLLTDPTALGAIVFIQVLIAAIWRFQQRFFAFLMLCFLAAGSSVPGEGAWLAARWIVLGVGTLVGFIVYMKQREHRFEAFHLVALICIIAAMVSATVSDSPEIAGSKALSLLMLFTYAASGGRLALVNRREQFFPALLAITETGTYLTAVSYLIFHIGFLGNPNSLGAIMGTLCVPVLLWGTFVAQSKIERRRRSLALGLAFLLVLFSQSRASILGCVAVCVLFYWAVRRYKLLLVGGLVALLLATVAVTLTPTEPQSDDLPVRHGGDLTSIFLYKGHESQGLLGSRKTPWEDTMSVIQQRPWFGSGFGTDINLTPFRKYSGAIDSPTNLTREHGNSYLAILTWVGLLGVVPFACLLILVAIYCVRVFHRLRKTQDWHLCYVPIAMIVVASLIDVAFEDWLFAVGYYLSVFFWVAAFALVDLLRQEYLSQAS